MCPRSLVHFDIAKVAKKRRFLRHTVYNLRKNLNLGFKNIYSSRFCTMIGHSTKLTCHGGSNNENQFLTFSTYLYHIKYWVTQKLPQIYTANHAPSQYRYEKLQYRFAVTSG